MNMKRPIAGNAGGCECVADGGPFDTGTFLCGFKMGDGKRKTDRQEWY